MANITSDTDHVHYTPDTVVYTDVVGYTTYGTEMAITSSLLTTPEPLIVSSGLSMTREELSDMINQHIIEYARTHHDLSDRQFTYEENRPLEEITMSNERPLTVNELINALEDAPDNDLSEPLSRTVVPASLKNFEHLKAQGEPFYKGCPVDFKYWNGSFVLIEYQRMFFQVGSDFTPSREYETIVRVVDPITEWTIPEFLSAAPSAIEECAEDYQDMVEHIYRYYDDEVIHADR